MILSMILSMISNNDLIEISELLISMRTAIVLVTKIVVSIKDLVLPGFARMKARRFIT